MIDSLIEVARVLIPGVVIAVLSAVITVRLAIRRFHEERWWEKKEESYSSLLEILHRFKSYAYKHWSDEYVPTELMSKNEKQALEEERKKTSQEYDRLRDLASFHLSDEAISILDEYEKKLNKPPQPGFDLVQEFEAHYRAVSYCLERLKEAAKRDLKVR